MTMIRLQRIDCLLKEAEELEYVETEQEENRDNIAEHLNGYQGERLEAFFARNIKREIYGLSTVVLQTILTLIQLQGPCQFIKDMIMDGLKLENKRSQTLVDYGR